MSARVLRQLPFAVLGTALVIVAPALAAAALPGGALVAVPACIAMSMALSAAAGALWRRLPQSRDVLFSDLMLWGWLRRLRTERRLERVESLVIYRGGPVEAIRDVRALQRVTRMLEARDAYTRRHSLRVTRHCEGIARELGLPADEVARVRTAAALHDIGKFFTPREVLNKPGKLDDAEFAAIKRHPGDGAELVAGVVDPAVESMIRHHHERMGGTGYPDGLAGDAIPLGARIIAVADTFDAMTSTRAYRTARPHARALRVLREEAGVALDAQVVGAFLAYYAGRRMTRWSSLASSLPHTVTPVRELLFAGGRALPALGASAAVLAAPAVSAETPLQRPAPAAVAAVSHRAAHAPRLLARLQAATPAADRDRRERARRGARAETVREGGSLTHAGRPRPSDHHPAGSEAPGSAPATSAPDRTAAGGGGQTQPTGTPAPTSAPPSASDAPATPSATATPAPSATSAPSVQVDPVTVPVGDGQVQTPPVEVHLPDLPIPLPPIKVPPLLP